MNIVLTKAQTNKMLKIKSLLEDIYDNGKLHGLTPFLAEDMAHCYNGIVKSIEHYGMTLYKEVANIFLKNGFKVEEIETETTNKHYHVHILTNKQEGMLER